MDQMTAHAQSERVMLQEPGVRVRVGVPLRTGTHHTVALFGPNPSDGYEEVWRERYPSRVRDLEVEAEVGSIVYQRTTSPASAEVLERYGVVLGDGRVDWGSDADWVVDFGPMGDVTRRGLRSPSASFVVQRGRLLSRDGEEAVGGAVEGTESAGGGSG